MGKIVLFTSRYISPFGEMMFVSTEKGLCYIALPGMEGLVAGWAIRSFGYDLLLHENAGGRAIEEMDEYFRGKLRDFSVPLDIRGTYFQKKVWEALMAIPYGQTRSYGDVARAIGNPGASRAVGMANAKNPLPIIVPCHRVIRSDGSPGGYGGGIDLKLKLLDLEAKFSKEE